ncbi:MAG: Z1 domain-containing protein [Defluviitaleaceae bacterium]|nr:Z1 domain-containing protein [Defluviitaleaceae bacterium]
MNKANLELLENMILTNLNTKYPDIPPTESDFDREVDILRQTLAPLYPASDDEFLAIKGRLRAYIVVQGIQGVLIKDKKQHIPWLSVRREELDFFFWNRYKKYLEAVKRWNPRVTGKLGQVSDEIVDYLGDPKSESDFQRRGLVLGDVQSGKTANYTAICNKAADTGYRVIIILAGMMENLRQQTQERLDAEFIGQMSQYFLDPKQEIKHIPVGVGKHGHGKRISTFTSVTTDFNKNTIAANRLSLYDINTTAVFVIKKNKSILNNMINWLKANNPKADGAINLPMLLIDDEADNASVNTKKEDEDPTAINDAIRRLLELFRQASYLGITATPYANIFIDPDREDEMRGQDLFPRDFIYSLAPPTSYIGAESIFGEEPKFSTALEELYPQEMDTFFPFNHRKDLIVDELPPSMKESLAYFLLVNAIRDVRGDSKEHRSMMIHVSRFTDVQDQIVGHINSWLEDMRSDLRNFARLSENESDKIHKIAFLRAVWAKNGFSENIGTNETPIRVEWHTFLSEYLHKAVAPIVVRSVNQRSSAKGLDYYSHKETGLRVIAVGGNSLSRGLTLEGLCVSYFYRKSIMYDTLLQMGRWFGYRLGYADLFKIWISVEAIDWYGYITAAAEELKQEIVRMRDANLTPMEFGLKVRQDPASLDIATKLIVTARNKMRDAELISVPIEISGRLLETPRLRADESSLASNEAVFKGFIKRLAQTGNRTEEKGAKYFWENVHKDEIEQLLRDFRTHLWQQSFQGSAIADFIRDSNAVDCWDVFIAQGEGSVYEELVCGEEILHIKTERRAVRATSSQISISGTKARVGTGGATKTGLTQEQKKLAEKKHRDSSIDPTKSVSDNAYLKIDRPPLLILHVIDVDKISKNKNNMLRSDIDDGVCVPDYLFALGVGIPGEGDSRVVNYMLNTVALKDYFEEGEDE